MAELVIGEITAGTDAVIEFGWDEPDPANPGERRAKDISTDTVTFMARTRLGASPLVSKTSADALEIEITDPLGEVVIDPVTGEETIRHGHVILTEEDFADVASDTDLYCALTLVTDPEGETAKTGFRLRIKVVE